ncbi:hypothetical protein PRIPAC_94885, partial [Pristionchus pacificus]
MAESGEMSILERCLEVALNPIGSLALGERLDANNASLMQTFNIVSPRIVELILSPYGFRVVESFLNANAYFINVGLAEHLSKEWIGLEQVLRTVRGRYVCDTLLKRKVKKLARKIISIAPEVDLCDSPEGLYCVLKVKGKSMDQPLQPGWRDALSRLIVLKSKSDKGADALEQAIVYGDYLVNEMVEILCCRRESFDNSTTAGLIIRLIERGSDDLKRAIVKCLCEPAENPTICKIRFTILFGEFTKACDANFTTSQRKHLDDLLASAAAPVVRPFVDVVDEERPKAAMETNESDSMNTTDGQNKKRRRESPVPPQSSEKKPREEAAEPQASTSKNTVSALSTVAPMATVPPAATLTAKPTVSAPST